MTKNLASILEFNDSQLRKLADVSSDMVQVSVAGIVLPYVLDTFNVFLALFVLISAMFFLTLSLSISRVLS